MSEWDNFNSVFWLTLSAGFFGCFAMAIKLCLKSKCSDTELCFGLIRIKRNTEGELEEEKFEIEHGLTPREPPPTPTSR